VVDFFATLFFEILFSKGATKVLNEKIADAGKPGKIIMSFFVFVIVNYKNLKRFF